MNRIILLVLISIQWAHVNAQSTFELQIVPPPAQQYDQQAIATTSNLSVVGGYFSDTANNRYGAALTAMDSTGAVVWSYLFQGSPGTQLYLTDMDLNSGVIYACGS